MFLEQLIKKNPQFINKTLELYKKGEILPDSYCIDVDTFMYNAKLILEEANKYNIKLLYMLKQVGRNPYLAKKLEEIGYSGAVLVDFKEVKVAMKNGLKLQNVGHLVQIPLNMLEDVILYGVDTFTVYSLEMIDRINSICRKHNIIQKIMLRIIEKDSNVYEGQEAGFSISDLKGILKEIKKYSNVSLESLTSFPCFLYSNETKKIEITNNLKSLKEAKEFIEKEGIKIFNLNMPSVSSVENMKDIFLNSGNEAEAGHSLSGTAPHCILDDTLEIPSYLYISEISHRYKGKSFFYGGGYYPRSNMKNALINSKVYEVNDFNSNNIDYYLSLDGYHDIFNPIILCFRTQMFVTRSSIVLIEGIRSGKARIVGRYNSQGSEEDE